MIYFFSDFFPSTHGADYFIQREVWNASIETKGNFYFFIYLLKFFVDETVKIVLSWYQTNHDFV